MTSHSQQEAKRDISSVNFTVTLTGLEIETILSAVGITTSMWVKNRRQMPGSFDLAALSSGCDKLTNPVEEDYQQRCATHTSQQLERYRPVCYPDCENEKHIQQKEREKVYRQLMAASINNENPGWVQIAEIEKILNPFDRVIPDIENLQEFPFRSYPKKEHRQTQGGE